MIPASFQLLGRTIRVRIVRPARWAHGANNEGVWDPSGGFIEVLDTKDRARMQQTFCHELTHAILDNMNDKWARDEPFVDTFGLLLHHAWTTIKPPRKRKRAK